jgi:2,4-dienoyl-CoA reductase-like NADH-dependent reductase (Old Yellow Enzyme family)
MTVKLGKHYQSKAGSHVLSSKFFLAPINTGFAPGGTPNERFLEFYKKRSGEYIGITYIGNVSVGEEWRTNANTPWLCPANLDIWASLSSQIRQNGSLPGIQLACKETRDTPLRGWYKRDANSFLVKARSQVLSLGDKEINIIIDHFVGSAIQAVKLGFKVIQLHAAHGYFLSKLLDERINFRKDHFGRDPLMIIQTIVSSIKSASRDAVADIRLSLFDGLEDKNIEFNRKAILIEKLTEAKIDMVSISNGTYDFNKYFIYPPKTWGHAPYVKFAKCLAEKYPKILFNIVGNIWDIRRLPSDGPPNLSYSIGRGLIAEPSLIAKSFAGEFDRVKWCSRGGDCLYYSNGEEHISCPLEPSLKNEAYRSRRCLRAAGSFTCK